MSSGTVPLPHSPQLQYPRDGAGPQRRLLPHLDMLAILLLGLIFTLLTEQPLLLALDEGLKVSPVTIQPLAVQVDDVCGYGIQEVAVVGDDQDCGGPRLVGGGHRMAGPVWEGSQLPDPNGLGGRPFLDLLWHL